MNPAATDIEQAILIRLRSGDERAFEEFYRIYSGRIYRAIVNMVKDREESRELLQEVFIKVWEKREMIDPDNSFRSYLFAIARNMVYNYLRKTSLESQIEAYLSATNSQLYSHVEEDVIYREMEATLHSAISRLPPQRQRIFVLCKVEGKSYAEVSTLLGISKATVNDHIVKATQFIKLELGDLSQSLPMAFLLAFTDL